MSFSRPGVQTELDRFYKGFSKDNASFESISKSAFTQSRQKLKPEAFIELNRFQLQYFNRNAPYQKNWKGYRIVAIDGSLLNLPHTEAIYQSFGSVKNQYEDVVSARCSFAYDVLNELVLDAVIAPRRSCEKDLAATHMEHLDPKTDLLVFDRGYPCQWLMGLLQMKGFKFCFRLSTAWKKAHALMEHSTDIDWTLIKGADREWGKLKTYGLSKKLEGLRLVSIPLKNGEKEVLVTNLLNREKYSLENLKLIYQLRWGVEEGYKSFKKALHIEYFSGRTHQAIQQDFHAKVFMMNMASIVRSQSHGDRIKNESRHEYKPNKTQAIAKVKDFLIDIFYSKGIKKIVLQLMNLIAKRLEIIRPNRVFPRPSLATRRRLKIINFKGI